MRVKIILSIISLLVLLNCSQKEAESNNVMTTSEQPSTGIQVLDESGKKLLSIQSLEVIEEVSRIIDTRQITLVKIFPLFTHKVVMIRDGKEETWAFNKKGFMRKEGKGSNELYKVEEIKLLYHALFSEN